MDVTDRTSIFDAIRAVRGVAFRAAEVVQVDELLDRLGIARPDGSTAYSGSRRINAAGLAIIKKFEGLELQAYLCPAGKWTVGWGHTGPDVHSGLVISEAKAEQLLRGDLDRFEPAVSKLAPVSTDGQFSALVSFAFNLGEESLRTSTLRRMHNEGEHAKAALQFARWNKARVNGKLKALSGLTRRRAAEAALYLKG
jgi:lysozyme